MTRINEPPNPPPPSLSHVLSHTRLGLGVCGSYQRGHPGCGVVARRGRIDGGLGVDHGIGGIGESGSDHVFNVVLEDGNLVVGRKFNEVGGGHIDLANSKPVIAAGEVKIVRGEVKYIDNTSRHYEPSGLAAQVAAENAFSQKELDVTGKYIEKV